MDKVEAKCSGVLDAVCCALERMDQEYCQLSHYDYQQISSTKGQNSAAELKFLERPIAYEFYHQLRCLIEQRVVDFGGAIVQGEVNKGYQHIFDTGRIPDFIIHVKGKDQLNLAVVEFKLTTNPRGYGEDFEKLVEFKNKLSYRHLIEVILLVPTSRGGRDQNPLEKAIDDVQQLDDRQKDGHRIDVLFFDLGKWKVVKRSSIRKKRGKRGLNRVLLRRSLG